MPDVFEALLDHLEASKVPSMETLPTSFLRTANQFKNLVVERAYWSVRGLAMAAIFIDAARSNSSIGELLISRWPGVLAWLCYFYFACFERNIVSNTFQDEMSWCLNAAFILPTNGDRLLHAITETPGTLRLATLLFMQENTGSYMEDVHHGTGTLLHFVQVKANYRVFDDVVELSGATPKLIVDTLFARLKRVVDSPDIQLVGAYAQLAFLEMICAFPNHPLCVVLHSRNTTAIAVNALLRLQEIPFASGKYSPESIGNVQYCMTRALSLVSRILRTESGTKHASQALQAGWVTALLECAPVAFTFKSSDRIAYLENVHQLTQLTTHLTIARQTSAELEKIENTLSVQERLNGSTPDVQTAWQSFREAISARREILAQMQALNSTPMSCDNVSCLRSAFEDYHLNVELPIFLSASGSTSGPISRSVPGVRGRIIVRRTVRLAHGRKKDTDWNAVA